MNWSEAQEAAKIGKLPQIPPKLLLDESPLVVLPSLACAIGLNEAVVIQQLHYHLRDKARRKYAASFRAGRYWVFNSYEEWQAIFPFFSLRTLRRVFQSLEERGLVLSEQYQKQDRDRRKWYTIDYAALAQAERNFELGRGEHIAAADASEAANLDASEAANLDASEAANLDASEAANLDASEAANLDASEAANLDASEAANLDASKDLPKNYFPKTFNKDTHTQEADAPASGATTSVCVCETPSGSGPKFTTAERYQYAQKHGLGSGWLTNSEDGRYDRTIDFYHGLARQKLQPAKELERNYGCELCHGSGWEIIKGKGAHPCPDCRQRKEATQSCTP